MKQYWRIEKELKRTYMLTGTQWHGSWLVCNVMFFVTVSKSVQNFLFLNVF